MRGVPRQRRGDLDRARLVDLDAQNFRRALEDDLEVLVGVELQPQHDAEARAQRRRQQPRARGCADEGKRPHLDGMSARRGALPDDDVELVILQR